ncbi:MAG: 30S ribosomal protein S1 [Chloroflexi bacterium]|nr:30S ribosomal protein S1 [Chloroflexota bacterium]|tara:strand:- start:5261 stop:6502 length:1242 start_codon:yes stop_codon:yes gene_type:complete
MNSEITPIEQEEEIMNLLSSLEPMKKIKRGDVVEGIVMSTDNEGAFIDIGQKSEGLVPNNEMRSVISNSEEDLSIGDTVLTLVIKAENNDQCALLSIDKAIGQQGWSILEKAIESDEMVEGLIIAFNRGGAIVESHGVQGFVPTSQLVTVPRVSNIQFNQNSDQASDPVPEDNSNENTSESEKKVMEISADDPRTEYVGSKIDIKVLEINRARNRAIFSEKKAVQEQKAEQKARIIEEIAEGDIRKGVVTGLSSFGAFVDLGGADGLIHISELSWNQIDSPQDIVTIGEEIDVFILKVDHETKKIALSIRRLQSEPWENITDELSNGDIVDAVIGKITDFGAFARIQCNKGVIEGLIHISELSPKVVSHPKEVVREGEQLKVKIMNLEPERRRLALSLKETLEIEITDNNTED